MAELGLPIILLTVIWGVFNPILKGLERLNNRHQPNLAAETHFELRQRWFMVYDDWLVLAIFSSVFVIVVTLLFMVLPALFVIVDEWFQSFSDTIFLTVGLVMLVLSLIAVTAEIANFFTGRRAVSRSVKNKCQ